MSIYNLTEEQILELIARGENELVEFKDANTNPEQIGKYIYLRWQILPFC